MFLHQKLIRKENNMPIVRFDPFADINNFQNQINDFFNDFAGASTSIPVTDIYGDDKSINVEVHLPHFKENEINVAENEGNLEISAEHNEKSDKKYLHRESASSYFRSFSLPKNVDLNNIKAKFDHGLLVVTLPYKELPKPKKIAIEAKSNK